MVYLKLLLQNKHWQKKLNDLKDEYGLKNSNISNVKNESSNLNTMTSVFKCVVKCEVYVWRKTFKQHPLGMFSPKLANMPLMMKKFVGHLNIFP